MTKHCQRCNKEQRPMTRRFRCFTCQSLVGLCCWRGSECAPCRNKREAAAKKAQAVRTNS